MNGNTVITIGRQFGSGGRQVGKKLADKLGIAFYDKELIEIAAMESGMSKKLLESADEKPTNSFLYSLSILGNGFSPMADMPINDKLFFIQSNVIKRVAQEGSCVIVGRCADYILRNNPNCVNVFIHACMNRKASNARSTSINCRPTALWTRYSGWTRAGQATTITIRTESGEGPDNYHLCIDSGIVGVDNAVDLIISFAEMKQKVCSISRSLQT